MFDRIKSAMTVFSDLIFGDLRADNTYCIPCEWVIRGKVYVNAPDFETAKAYLKTHRVSAEYEDAVCFNTNPDTEGLILCMCGNCGEEYMISSKHNPNNCPRCGHGNKDCSG